MRILYKNIPNNWDYDIFGEHEDLIIGNLNKFDEEFIIVFLEKFIPFCLRILKYFFKCWNNTYHLVSRFFYILSICISYQYPFESYNNNFFNEIIKKYECFIMSNVVNKGLKVSVKNLTDNFIFTCFFEDIFFNPF